MYMYMYKVPCVKGTLEKSEYLGMYMYSTYLHQHITVRLHKCGHSKDAFFEEQLVMNVCTHAHAMAGTAAVWTRQQNLTFSAFPIKHSTIVHCINHFNVATLYTSGNE